MTPGPPLLTLLPRGGRLEARLFVPTRAVGFVRPGDGVELLYDAFPHQRFGSFRARVRRVASAILAPDEVPSPIVLDESVCTVDAELGEQWVDAFGQRIALKPGMLLDAYILQERRPIMQWLLSPLQGWQERI